MRLQRLALVALSAVVASCGSDNPTETTPAAQPVKLAFLTHLSSVTADNPIASSIQVEVQDASGKRVASTASVTLALSGSSTATLTGAATASAVDGVATFSNLAVHQVASGLTLVASASSLQSATSDAFSVTPGAAAALAFVDAPTSGSSGVALTTMHVAVRDQYANTVTTSHTVQLALGTNTTGGALAGTTTRTTTAGIATFDNVSIDKVGSYTLAATATSLTPASSATLAIAAGQATKLVISAQPANTTAGAAISPGIQVTIQDAAGNTVPSTASITIAIATNPGSATLNGTLTRNAVAGVATFNDLTVNKAASGYTFAVSSAGLTGATSSAFNISAAAAAKLAFVNQPAATVTTGGVLSPIQVAIQDAYNNTVTSATNSVSIDISGFVRSGMHMIGTTSVAAAAGIATFSNIRVSQAGTALTASAGAAGLTSATSNAFDAHMSFAKISADSSRTCALSVDGVPFCWGTDGSAIDIYSLYPAPTASLTNASFAQVSTGRDNACAIVSAGTAYCWGSSNDGGEQGRTGAAAGNPTVINGSHTFSTLSGGWYHTCGIEGTALYCWGANFKKQIGDGTTNDAFAPTQISAATSWLAVGAGRYHTCAVTTSNDAYCWGTDNARQLGGTSAGDQTTPVAVQGGLKFTSISAGGGATTGHTCALTSLGAAYCWGDNSVGQFGAGTPGAATPTPTAVTGGIAFTSISVGSNHTCGLTSAGVAYCWGSNASGQLGDNSQTERDTPTAVSGGLTFAQISAAATHTCGVTTSGAVYCWGRNLDGQLGDGTHNLRLVPTQVIQ